MIMLPRPGFIQSAAALSSGTERPFSHKDKEGDAGADIAIPAALRVFRGRGADCRVEELAGRCDGRRS